MKRLINLPLFVSLVAGTFATLAAEDKPNTGPFTAPQDAELYKSARRHFTLYPLLNEVKSRKEFSSVEVGGRLFRTSYQLPPDYEPFNLLNNYKNRIQELGGEVIFECSNESCGNPEKVKRFIKPLHTTGDDDPHILTARFSFKNKEVYTSIYCYKWARAVNLQLDIIEVTPEPLDLVQIGESYLSTGVQAIEVEDLANKDVKGSKDHPMVTRLPGAFIDEYSQFDFGQTKVVTAITDGKVQARELEGRITDIAYQLPRSYSEYEVNANYRAALGKLGFVSLFECNGKQQCGPKMKIYYAIDPLINNGRDESQFYSLYKLNRPEGNVYAMTYILGYSGGLWANLRIIEESTLKDDRLVIDLEGLTDKMAQTGHVALDGLLFEFDKDVMLPEATEVVNTVATYLKQHPKQSFYVVGHTDDQGKQGYNQQLSEKRAQAVITKLTKNHGIPQSQLTAAGVGEYSPVANNMTDEGKKQNRRVELVLRSDKK